MKRPIETRFCLSDALVFDQKKPGFLEKVEDLLDWEPCARLLKKRYERHLDATGKAGYPPLVMFKILLLQRWYDLSDTELEEALCDRISFMRFAGLSLSSAKPDSTTICRFRQALMERNLEVKLLERINKQFEKAGLLIKTGVIVDATVIQSSCRPRKEVELMAEDRKEEETPQLGPEHQAQYSADPEAAWIKKSGKSTYGFKAHLAVDARDGFFLGGHSTPANRFDGKELGPLLEGLDFKTRATLFADKAYWSQENRDLLKNCQLTNGILKKAVRGKPLQEMDKAINRLLSSVCCKVERGIGSLKCESFDLI